MSGESPAAVLYSSDGTELNVVSGSAIPAGTRSILISGNTPGGNATYVPASANGALGVSNMSNTFVVKSNATLTTTGSQLVTGNFFGTQQINLVVNLTVTPTGTTPTITFTIQEVDPGNGTTVYGQTASTTALNATGVTVISITNTTSPAVQVSWTVTGTTPSFTGVYATVTTRVTPGTQAISGTVTANNASVGTDGSAALSSDTQIGGKVTTAAPAYTNGNLNALSLTTVGGLRIDGVYAGGTATGTAADMSVNGGYVTTAAPTYTTGQLNALSLTTAGALRVDGSAVTQPVSGTVTANAGTGNFNNASVGTDGAAAVASDTQMGGKVTTAAPTYTTGNLNALSLTTGGLLRIDGVYPINATTPTSDVTFIGGAVTTAAPAYTTGQLSALSLDTSGNLRVTGFVTTNKATTSAFTTVAGATSNTSILASNGNRISAAIYNNTNKNMYILCNSGTASTTNYTILLMQGSYWEIPSDYTGAINAVWATGVSGSANITEFTP